MPITSRPPTKKEVELFKKVDISKLKSGDVYGSSGGSGSTGGGSRKRKPGISTPSPQEQQAIMRKLQAEAQRRAEIQKQQQQAEAERQRIESQRKKLLQQGASYSSQRVGNTVIERTRMGDSIIQKNVDLRTGRAVLREYKGGRIIGGVDYGGLVGKPIPVGTKLSDLSKEDKSKVLSVGKTFTKTQAVFGPAERTKRGVVSEKLGIGKLSYSINNYKDLLRTKRLRNKITPAEESALIASGFISGLVDTFGGLLDLPQAVITLSLNPSQILNIPSQLKNAGAEFGYLLDISPGEAIAYIGGSVYGIKATSQVLNTLKKIGNVSLAKLNPKFSGNLRAGSVLNVKVSPTKTVRLKIVKSIPKEKLASQIDRAGRRITGISSQADDLFNILNKRTGVKIRKPIPGEKGFSTQTKVLLKKFDDNLITKKELYKLDGLLRAEGTKGLLERSFFIDPSMRVRPSRLGVSTQKTKLIDYLSSDVTFKRAKPQIFLFDDLKVSSFPKRLKPIANKIKNNKPLTKLEANQLLEWQLKQSGKAKPLGFVSRESEVILSPGEVLRKVKKIGITTLNGERIPIWKVEIYKPKGVTKELLTKFNKGTINTAERNTLKRLLQKNTGINYASGYKSGVRYVNIKYIGLSSGGRLLKSNYLRTPRRNYATSVRRTSKPVSRKSTATSVRRTSKPVSRKSTATSVRRTSKPVSRKKRRNIPIISNTIKVTRSRSTPLKRGYLSYAQQKKVTSVKTLPLTKERAFDILAYYLDKRPSYKGLTVKTLERTSSDILRRKLKSTPKGYFRKNRNKFIVRRLKKGRETYEMIEKKFRRDSIKEKKGKR